VTSAVDAGPDWPDLPFAAWSATKKTLHLYAQMLGKLRVALSPAQPNWMFTSLALTARGFTTGPMPAGVATVAVTLDVFASTIAVERSDGRARSIPLVPVRTIAEVYRDLSAALAAIGVNVHITTIPQELADTTPLDTDRRAIAYDPAAVQRWFHAVTASAVVFDTWRAHFFGRSGIQLWWGAFDLSLMLFSGKHVPAPRDRGYLLRYDLDAELMNAGFYPGDDLNPAPVYYGYLYPQPAQCETLPVAPPQTAWSDKLGEWILPYDDVRASADPAATLSAFLDSVYAVCGDAGGWDRTALTYASPKKRSG
jgi:hypothetical protein